MGVVYAEVMEADCDFQSGVGAQVVRCGSGTTNSSSLVVVIHHFVLVFDILSILPWIILEGTMTEAAFIERLNSMVPCGDMISRFSSF